MDQITKTIKNLKFIVSEDSLEIRDAETDYIFDIKSENFSDEYIKYYQKNTEMYKMMKEFSDKLSNCYYKLWSCKKSIVSSLPEKSEANDLTTTELHKQVDVIDTVYNIIGSLRNDIKYDQYNTLSVREVEGILTLLGNGYQPMIDEITDELNSVARELGAQNIRLTKTMILTYMYNKAEPQIPSTEIMDLLPRSFEYKDYLNYDYQVDSVLNELLFEKYDNHRRDRMTISTSILSDIRKAKLPDLVASLGLVPSCGPAKTIIGNMLRACERIIYRYGNDDETGLRYTHGNFVEMWNLADELRNLDNNSKSIIARYLTAAYKATVVRHHNPKNLEFISAEEVSFINRILDSDYSEFNQYFNHLDIEFTSVIDLAKRYLNDSACIPHCDMPENIIAELKGKVVSKCSSILEGKTISDGTVTFTISVDDLNYSYIKSNLPHIVGLLTNEVTDLIGFIEISQKLIKNSNVDIKDIRMYHDFNREIELFMEGDDNPADAMALEIALYLILKDIPDFLNDKDDRDWRSKLYYTELVEYESSRGYDW
jgi:hypothetical protein